MEVLNINNCHRRHNLLGTQARAKAAFPPCQALSLACL